MSKEKHLVKGALVNKKCYKQCLIHTPSVSSFSLPLQRRTVRIAVANIRAGDKPDVLADKIAGGRAANIMEFPMTELDGADIAAAAELFGADMPNPSEYLSARQHNGKPLGADEIFRETWLWFKELGCARLVNSRLLESYA